MDWYIHLVMDMPYVTSTSVTCVYNYNFFKSSSTGTSRLWTMFEVLLVLECYYELLTKRLNLNIILTFVKIIGNVFTVTLFIAVLSTVHLNDDVDEHPKPEE